MCFFRVVTLPTCQIAFAEHQNNFVKMEGFNEKCSGLRKIDWSDNLKGETVMGLHTVLGNLYFVMPLIS